MSRRTHLKTDATEFCNKSPWFLDIKKALDEDECGWTPCIGCKKLVGYTNSDDLCLYCIGSNEKMVAIEAEANESDLKSFQKQLEKINRKSFKVHKGYPSSTAQAFSLALNYCHLAELVAKTDRDLWKAKIQLAKIKAVWVLDVRGGSSNWHTWLEKVKKRCNKVLVGKINEVWQEACEIETKLYIIGEKKTTKE